MQTRFAPTTRARDKDRVHACTTLDAGLAEGQLSEEEHATRVGLAMEAGTLAELHYLIDDLQGDTELTPLPTGRPTRRGGIGAVVGLTVAAVVVVLVLRGCSSTGSDSVEENLLTARSLTTVASDTRDLLGTTAVDQLVVYPEYAGLTAADGPRKAVRYDYRGGSYDADDVMSTPRSADTPQIDLAAVDWATIAAVLAGARQSLNLTRIDTVYLIAQGDDDGPRLTIQAGNDDQESGNLIVDPAGNFLSVRPFDPAS